MGTLLGIDRRVNICESVRGVERWLWQATDRALREELAKIASAGQWEEECKLDATNETRVFDFRDLSFAESAIEGNRAASIRDY